jgi:hypothetical protein
MAGFYMRGRMAAMAFMAHVAFTGLVLGFVAAVPYWIAWIFFRRDGVSFWNSSWVIKDNDQRTETGKWIWRCGIALFVPALHCCCR